MKAYLEIVKLNLSDIVATSPCGKGYTPEIENPCEDPIME